MKTVFRSWLSKFVEASGATWLQWQAHLAQMTTTSDEEPMDRTRHAQLAQRIDEEPTLADNYLVLADLLLEDDDARGELIQLQHARLRAAAEAAGAQLSPELEAAGEISEREEELLAELSPEYAGDATFEWYCGFVWRAELDVGDSGYEDILSEALAHPSLAHVQQLLIDAGVTNEDESTAFVLPLVVAQPRPSLRRLLIRHRVLDQERNPPHGKLDLAPLWAAAPRLTELTAMAERITIAAPAQTSLSRLTLEGQVNGEDAATLIERSPNLRALVLADVVEPAQLWSRLSRLAHLEGAALLSIGGAALDDAAVEALLGASFIASIGDVRLPSATAAQEAALRARMPQVKLAGR
jgi:hypothetical protein